MKTNDAKAKILEWFNSHPTYHWSRSCIARELFGDPNAHQSLFFKLKSEGLVQTRKSSIENATLWFKA